MKRFLTYIILFASPIIFCFLIGDDIISSTLKESNSFAQGEFSVWNDIYSGKASSEILIYGSSRAWVHIDPMAIENALKVSAYNFGVDGHNFTMQNLRHHEYLKHNKKPKVIIYSLDVFTLFQRKDLYNKDAFLPYLYNNPQLKETLSKYDGFDISDYKIPCVRYFGKKKAITEILKFAFGKPTENHGRTRGFESKDRLWSTDILSQTAMKSVEFPIDSTSARNFEIFLNDCSKQHIKVMFVYTPEYYKAKQFIKNRAEILAYYHTVSNRHNIPFLDFSNDEICNSTEYFYNSEHMNRKGATKFNTKFCDILKALTIAQPQFSKKYFDEDKLVNLN